MKKIILLLSFITSVFITTQAQTEISGYLDSDPSDGIGQTAVTTYAWPAAVNACRSLVHDGKTDWYLPSYEEIALFTHGTSGTGATPGCAGSNCDWVASTGASSGTSKCWTRSVSSDNGYNVKFGNTVSSGQYSAMQVDVPSELNGVRCVR